MVLTASAMSRFCCSAEISMSPVAAAFLMWMGVGWEDCSSLRTCGHRHPRLLGTCF